ncbi:restriction endonuclease [Novosphingobium sp.]|uniref:restriction endonuclease n=1 Tax=Novosphingobium sp. TaxID=1874826 RepID=UPI002FDE5538
MTPPLSILLIVAFLFLIYRHYRVPIRHRWRRRQAREMLAQFSGRDRHQPAVLHFSRLRAMDALAFEELLLEAFERRGFRIIRNHRYSGDGGIDGQVVIAGRTWLIQAKRYAGAIRPEHVRDFTALCSRHDQPGLFIHTGRTGGQSREVLAGLADIEIISGQRLLALLTGAPFAVPSRMSNSPSQLGKADPSRPQDRGWSS